MPYKALKAAILNRFHVPTQICASRFMDEEPLSGRNILHYIQEMDDNACSLSVDHLKHVKILHALPVAVHNVLIFNDQDNYLQIAHLTHAIMTNSTAIIVPVTSNKSTFVQSLLPLMPPQDNAPDIDTTLAINAIDQS